jgi:hypothetical protein
MRPKRASLIHNYIIHTSLNSPDIGEQEQECAALINLLDRFDVASGDVATFLQVSSSKFREE